MHLHHNLMALAAAGAIFLAPATSFADAASEAAQMAATPVQATDDSAAAQSAVGMPNPMVSAASYGELTEALGHAPSDEEVAEAANLPLATVNRLRGSRQIDVQSLNAPISDGDPDGGEFQDFFQDDTEPAPDQQLIKLEDVENLLSLLETLTEREQKVLRLRFGLDGEPIRTLDEVGTELNCTNERVRQIQNQALRKLHAQLENMR